MGTTDLLYRILRDYGLVNLCTAFILIVTAYTLSYAVYNIYIHPLSKYPGPRFAVASRLWYSYHIGRGTLVYSVHELHKRYGQVVRIAPNELSFADPSAWNDIYGHRIGKPELAKDAMFYSTIVSGPGSIIKAERSRHGLLRKQASHGFSDRALKGQEQVINGYADLMMRRLMENIETGKPTVDMAQWYNYFTFDVMGDMVFGQSFECLTDWGYHPWVQLIFDSIKAGAAVRAAMYLPIIAPLAPWLIPPNLRKRRMEQRNLASERAASRKALGETKQDLVSGYLVPENGVTPLEYQNTAMTFIIAGSETTATLMSGVTYYLLRDPDRLAKLQAELRSAFSDPEEITYDKVNKLPYLLACLNEALRIYPPTPESQPRNTGPQAEIISGQVVPAHTVVGVHQWSANHSPRNFKDPDEFIPERWIEGNKGYESDRRDAVQSFSVGPRNCLGKNLAYFEMRLLVARLFWQFDLQLDARSNKWNVQRSYSLWEKPPLLVKLTPHAK